MAEHQGKYVSYLRVSTQRQGESGLSVEAQRASVAAYLNGGSWRLVEEHVEVESGKRNDRPELKKAFAACRAYNAKLVISRLDRLSRNADFLLGLEAAGVEFVCVDQPHANRLTVGVLALVAEEESRAISIRTKAALAAAKARGKKLGKPKGTLVPRSEIGRVNGAKVNAEIAKAFAERMRPILNRVSGLSAKAAAAELAQRGYATARGGQWASAQVINIRRRLEAVS
jgi:DNA invertase Pin-like site-specific DNA recombinase